MVASPDEPGAATTSEVGRDIASRESSTSGGGTAGSVRQHRSDSAFEAAAGWPEADSGNSAGQQGSSGQAEQDRGGGEGLLGEAHGADRSRAGHEVAGEGAPAQTSGRAGSSEGAAMADDQRAPVDARHVAGARPGVSELGQSDRGDPSHRVGDRGPGVSVPPSAFGEADEQGAVSAANGADRGRRGVRIADHGSGRVSKPEGGGRGLTRLRSAYSSVGATLRSEISRCVGRSED